MFIRNLQKSKMIIIHCHYFSIIIQFFSKSIKFNFSNAILLKNLKEILTLFH